MRRPEFNEITPANGHAHHVISDASSLSALGSVFKDKRPSQDFNTSTELTRNDWDTWVEIRADQTPAIHDEFVNTYYINMILHPETNDVNKTNDSRLKLLGRKYAGKDSSFSPEEAARLDIVTERIRLMLPAVSSRDVEKLEMAVDAIRKVTLSDEKIRRELGIYHEK